MTGINLETSQGQQLSTQVADTSEPHGGTIHHGATNLRLDPTECNLYHNFHTGLAVDNGTRKCFGTRTMVNGQAGPYEWLTYKQVANRVEMVSSGIHKLGGLERQGIVGIFSKNRVEWSLVEHACNRMSYILVPLYETLGADAVPFIVNHTVMRVLFFAKAQFEVLLQCKSHCPSLTLAIQFEDVTEDQRVRASKMNLDVKSFQQVELLGEQCVVAPDLPGFEDICTICYTSGTTGTPKGVVLTHGNLVCNAIGTNELLHYSKDDVHLSYLPLAHVYERLMQTVFLRQGASIGFFQGEVRLLLADAQMLKPTVFSSVPRVLHRVCDQITPRIDGTSTDTPVTSEVHNVLGGRVRLIVSGSAPLSVEVKALLSVAFACPVLEGYGMTETGGTITVASPALPLGPHCGIPVANCEVRLRDVPEMNYFSHDMPRPRGEILVRGDSVFSGYYQEPELTAQVLDQHGWFATGDIGCWNADGTLSIVDRKKAIFKLSQGEYVAPEKIEAVYLKSPFVAQIFCYGDSFKDRLVAIVVVDPEVALAWAQQNAKHELSLADLCVDPDFTKRVADNMTAIAKQSNLRGFEMVKALHLVADPFDVARNLVTPTFKLKRPQLQQHFQTHIDRLYSINSNGASCESDTSVARL